MRTDSEFLKWIHDRLVDVHGENEHVDYMHRLRKIIENVQASEIRGKTYDYCFVDDCNFPDEEAKPLPDDFEHQIGPKSAEMSAADTMDLMESDNPTAYEAVMMAVKRELAATISAFLGVREIEILLTRSGGTYSGELQFHAFASEFFAETLDEESREYTLWQRFQSLGTGEQTDEVFHKVSVLITERLNKSTVWTFECELIEKRATRAIFTFTARRNYA